MQQVAAQALGMTVSKMTFELGDTGLPEAPASGGSQTVASVGPAVYAATARSELVQAMVGEKVFAAADLTVDKAIAHGGSLLTAQPRRAAQGEPNPPK